MSLHYSLLIIWSSLKSCVLHCLEHDRNTVAKKRGQWQCPINVNGAVAVKAAVLKC